MFLFSDKILLMPIIGIENKAVEIYCRFVKMLKVSKDSNLCGWIHFPQRGMKCNVLYSIYGLAIAGNLQL